MYFTCGSLSLSIMRGLKIPPDFFFFFFLACFCAFRDVQHSRFRCLYLKLCLLDFLKMLGLPFFKSTHVFFACGSVHVSIWTVFWLEILARINFLFSGKFSSV